MEDNVKTFDFDAIKRRNEKKKKEKEEERLRNNKNVLRQYNIKPKGSNP